MNSKGQAIFYTLMVAIVVVIFALATVPALRQNADIALAPSTSETVGLDCSNPSISDYDKANCTIVDLGMPYFFWGLLGIASLILGAKLIFQ